MAIFRAKFLDLIWLAVLLVACSNAVQAQSTDPNYPTPLTTSEIDGSIRARDIGDSRLTSYYYAFGGKQGDIFINAVTRNFSGDIDVFIADGLRPLTKMVIYPDGGVNETGRLVYLRKGERLVLRIQGRSPNDDPATFRIRFGGSFVALADDGSDDAPTVGRIENESGVRVNSVGTIVEIVPKPQPAKPDPVAAKVAVAKKARTAPTTRKATVKADKPVTGSRPAQNREDTGVKTVFGKKQPTARSTAPTATPPKTTRANTKAGARPAEAAVKTPKAPVEPPAKKPDPLASIRLVVELKQGDVIERPMSEVLTFSVDKGVLTVVGKDGKTALYSILDVAKVTIQ